MEARANVTQAVLAKRCHHNGDAPRVDGWLAVLRSC